MKKGLLLLAVAFFGVSCSQKEWTQEDKDQFKKDCLAGGGTEELCDCGLNKLIVEFPNMEEAQKKLDSFNEKQLEEFYHDCLPEH